MHAMNTWLTDAATVVVGAHWTLYPWRHNNVGVSLRARRDTSQVTLHGGVTAGQVGHNSINNNNDNTVYFVIQYMVETLN